MERNESAPVDRKHVPAEIEAAILREAHGDFAIERVAFEPPRADEVVVRIVATGLCHTDVAVRDRAIPSPLPIVLGHEGAGVVVAIGTAVRQVAVGDPVVLTYLSCGECRECRSGAPAFCSQLGMLCFGGARPDGSHALHDHTGGDLHDRFFGQSSFATHAIAHERNVVKVRADAPLEMLGPLACGVMTGAGTVWNELDVGPGSTLAVFGVGAVGLSAIMAAKIAGATTIIAIDRVATRLDVALELGATHAINSSEVDVVAGVREVLPSGVDHAFDTTGRLAVMKAAIAALRHRGTAALVALVEQGEMGLDVHDLIVACKSVRGVVEGGGSAHLLIPKLIDLHMAGLFPFDRLVTFYRLDQINEAVKDSAEGRTIKPILRMQG
jgi:aryl-alcohol dehydrogenase